MVKMKRDELEMPNEVNSQKEREREKTQSNCNLRGIRSACLDPSSDGDKFVWNQQWDEIRRDRLKGS